VQLSIADNVTGTAEQVVDSVQKIIAFRKIQLVQQLDAAGNGSCFRFDVNDRPMFAKGANFIPADAFNTRMTAERLEQLLQNAIDANMNMVRYCVRISNYYTYLIASCLGRRTVPTR
jgi:beta-galactosidase/beta-glucuronidase